MADALDAPLERIATFRRFAAEARRIAPEADDVACRQSLITMAGAFDRLAAEELRETLS